MGKNVDNEPTDLFENNYFRTIIKVLMKFMELIRGYWLLFIICWYCHCGNILICFATWESYIVREDHFLSCG